ncbi:MAG TPA: GNAT family N-acetyltransferase [Anaerolineaceae bacterium]|nr:GNAT family N-acetyltransferase [Anaerolineaceae bacterium]
MMNKSIRPLHVATDLYQIADLLSICFSDSMDEDGERYIAYLRQFSQSLLFTKIAERYPEKYSLPGEGFVYEDGGRVVGNITLSPMKFEDETVYLISNVAVEPEHRGRGIAKLLTQTALRYVECKGVKQVWLQVKQGNQAAIKLYDQLDFQSFMVRTTWMRKKTNVFLKRPEKFALRKRKKGEWKIQRELLESTYPVELTAAYEFEIASVQPNLKRTIRDFFLSRVTLHWAAEINEQLGFVSYASLQDQSYVNLWIAAPVGYEQQFLKTLVPAVQARLGKEVRLNYPQHEYGDCFHELGMQELNTLVWKRKYLV